MSYLPVDDRKVNNVSPGQKTVKYGPEYGLTKRPRKYHRQGRAESISRAGRMRAVIGITHKPLSFIVFPQCRAFLRRRIRVGPAGPRNFNNPFPYFVLAGRAYVKIKSAPRLGG